jgi:hypothetical protein
VAETLISFDALRAPVESLLTQAHARRVEISQATLLTEAERRNQVWRCALDGVSPAQPQNVIVKRVDPQAYEPNNPESWHTQRFFRDWAGAAFLTNVCGEQRHGPRFYGGHRELGFVILEDMGEHRSLVQPLLEGNAVNATAALMAYAERLGRMHADTIGREDDYHRLVQQIDPVAAPKLLPTWQDAKKHWGEMLTKAVQSLAEAHITLSDATFREAERVFDAVSVPGSFTAFLHADPCPDNVFYDDGKLRLIDFEFARFGHALMDGLYGRIPFPTCWCANAIPDDVVGQMEARYRAELSRTCTAARDDALFDTALVAVCASWVVQTLNWHLADALKEPDGEWGIATIRARILSRLDMFVKAAAGHTGYVAFIEDMCRVRDTLGRAWPEAQPLPLYPAFR